MLHAVVPVAAAACDAMVAAIVDAVDVVATDCWPLPPPELLPPPLLLPPPFPPPCCRFRRDPAPWALEVAVKAKSATEAARRFGNII